MSAVATTDSRLGSLGNGEGGREDIECVSKQRSE